MRRKAQNMDPEEAMNLNWTTATHHSEKLHKVKVDNGFKNT
jgi:hypothetical protein